MFASAAPRNMQSNFSNAYRDVGVQTGVLSASPHQLVLMLFDGFLECVTQARGAIAARNIDLKCKSIIRAVRIMDEGLKANLNLQQGGQLASDLNALYGYITMRLTHANISNDVAALEECARLVEPIRSAWIAIGSSQALSAS